jgi:hypothetical protein
LPRLATVCNEYRLGVPRGLVGMLLAETAHFV